MNMINMVSINNLLCQPVSCYIVSILKHVILISSENNSTPVIICKNNKHLVTLYNVIFSNMIGTLSHLNYIFYQHKRAIICH